VLKELIRKVSYHIVKNRWGYTRGQLEQAKSTGLVDAVELKDMSYWIKIEPVCANHCMGTNYEGKAIYLDAMGGLIRHKCPPSICIHALSQLSPLVYSYYDHMLQKKDPNGMIFDTVACTDPGLKRGGLGACTFRVTREKMPILEQLRSQLALAPYMFLWNRRQVGACRAVAEAPVSGGPEPTEFMRRFPLDEKELEAFLAAPKRALRLRGLEEFKDYRIAIRVVESQACPAGHAVGDEFILNPMGCVVLSENDKDICIMALNRAWYRVMLLLERMAEGTGGDVSLNGDLLDIPISCYGGAWPLGACGRIMMKVEARKGTHL
jgi:uncharacterized repeat protein (TIGR04076 family)